jgi:hypothetical protein
MYGTVRTTLLGVGMPGGYGFCPPRCWESSRLIDSIAPYDGLSAFVGFTLR